MTSAPPVDRTFADLWRRAAEQHGDRTFLVFRSEDGEVDSWTYGEFDRIVAAEILEHVPADIQALAELVRVLRPGGTIAVTVPRWFPEVVCWKLSREYGITGVPTFVIGRYGVVGAQPYEALEQLVKKATGPEEAGR